MGLSKEARKSARALLPAFALGEENEKIKRKILSTQHRLNEVRK